MANVSIVKLKVRRGPDVQRQQIVLDQGELGFTTDTHRFFIGDGATVGGISPAIKYYSTSFQSLSSSSATSQPFQIGDIVYDTISSSFYNLTGAPNNIISNYLRLPILTTGNVGTLVPTVSSGLPAGSLWINTNNNQKVLSIV